VRPGNSRKRLVTEWTQKKSAFGEPLTCGRATLLAPFFVQDTFRDCLRAEPRDCDPSKLFDSSDSSIATKPGNVRRSEHEGSHRLFCLCVSCVRK
jgi:hypothetical protein